MAAVAKLAGVSAGPRQYYFPSRDDLFVAVVEHLIAQQELHYRVAEGLPESVSERLSIMVYRSFAYAGTAQHIAMLEIRLALKHQAGLRRRVGSRLARVEEDNDLIWMRMLRRSGRTDEQIIGLRRMLASLTRGMVLDPANKEEKHLRAVTAQVKLFASVFIEGSNPDLSRSRL